MYIEQNITTKPEQAADIDKIKVILSKQLNIPVGDLKNVKILKRSIDARSRDIKVQLKLAIYDDAYKPEQNIISAEYKNVKNSKTVLVIGAGPGGLFAALKLIELGLKPIIIESPPVKARTVVPITSPDMTE